MMSGNIKLRVRRIDWAFLAKNVQNYCDFLIIIQNAQILSILCVQNDENNLMINFAIDVKNFMVYNANRQYHTAIFCGIKNIRQTDGCALLRKYRKRRIRK